MHFFRRRVVLLRYSTSLVFALCLGAWDFAVSTGFGNRGRAPGRLLFSVVEAISWPRQLCQDVAGASNAPPSFCWMPSPSGGTSVNSWERPQEHWLPFVGGRGGLGLTPAMATVPPFSSPRNATGLRLRGSAIWCRGQQRLAQEPDSFCARNTDYLLTPKTSWKRCRYCSALVVKLFCLSNPGRQHRRQAAGYCCHYCQDVMSPRLSSSSLYL